MSISVARVTLTEYIQADLAKRLRDGSLAPSALKLIPLATHYQTSTRPVRMALSRLRKGQPPTHATRRRRIVAPHVTPDSPPGAMQSSTSRLADRIAKDLVELTMQESEHFIRETRSAAKYGVSATMVREVFSGLVGQGLLEHIPRRGWRVRRLTQKDLDAFLEVREALEIKALHSAWDRLNLEQFRAFLNRNELPSSPRRRPRIDNGFHREIIRVADNYYITDFFNRHGRFFDILFAWEDKDRLAAIQTVEQHRRILTAIVDRNLPRAEAELVEHIRNNHPLLQRLLTRLR